jgi:hypothetical protein
MNMENDYNIGFCKPFGPMILECQCPEDIVLKLNLYVDEMNEEQKKMFSSKFTDNKDFPNLLSRDFEVIYLTPKASFDTGLSFFLLQICQAYNRQSGVYDKQIILPKSTFSDELLDVWINRYERLDYTPPHDHRGNVSGIIILDLPDDATEMEKTNLEFFWDNEHYRPYQEIGKTFLFPSNLMHWVAKHINEKERRTLSFNLFLH